MGKWGAWEERETLAYWLDLPPTGAMSGPRKRHRGTLYLLLGSLVPRLFLVRLFPSHWGGGSCESPRGNSDETGTYFSSLFLPSILPLPPQPQFYLLHPGKTGSEGE